MDPVTLLTCALIGLAAGTLGGLLGVGGGIVMVPAFIRFLGLPAHQAVATSISVIVFISLSAALKHHQQGSTQWKIVGLVLVTSVLGAYLGAAFTDQIPERTLRLGFAVFLMIVSIDMAARAWRIS
ncbi:MAG: sulfite exporter TauE/SafE family protein [Deltaproteobacteria bacterium]|nr:sulfite exporter TauE/SafE family protein [Deltaproteobacteria bacterium]MBW2446298.1 sulfite exporter TauE/SafE family protein [Deltaproteobacteria bacterium]